MNSINSTLQIYISFKLCHIFFLSYFGRYLYIDMYSGSNFVLILISPVFILIMKLFLTWIRNLFVQHSEILHYTGTINKDLLHCHLFQNRFIQDSGLLKVRFRQVGLWFEKIGYIILISQNDNFKFQNISSSCLSSPFITQLYNENM
jgi:hypothetical protein